MTLSQLSIKPSTAHTMLRPTKVVTAMGPVALYHKAHPSPKTPLLFLHGLLFDHQLWNAQMAAINDRNLYAIDMPLHGNSIEGIKKHWNMEDLKKMVLHLLDSLTVAKVHAIGHSWGSMVLLETALEHPERFAGLTLFNLPFAPYTPIEKWGIRLQHLGLVFKSTYIKVASGKLFARASLLSNAALGTYLRDCMEKMPNGSIAYLDKTVRIGAQDRSTAFRNLQVPFLVVVAQEDTIAKKPPTENILEVPGEHTTPLEL